MNDGAFVGEGRTGGRVRSEELGEEAIVASRTLYGEVRVATRA